MTRWLNGLQPWGVFLLRLVLGTAMIYHGWPKVVPPGGPFHHHSTAAIDHYSRFISSLGLPPWLGYVSALTELVGGIFLILGLLTRFTAFLVTINMLVAIVYVDIHHGYSGTEYSLALAAIAFMLLLTGPGTLAVDKRLGLV